MHLYLQMKVTLLVCLRSESWFACWTDLNCCIIPKLWSSKEGMKDERLHVFPDSLLFILLLNLVSTQNSEENPWADVMRQPAKTKVTQIQSRQDDDGTRQNNLNFNYCVSSFPWSIKHGCQQRGIWNHEQMNDLVRAQNKGDRQSPFTFYI